jgi:hypothetical protein
MKHLSRRQFIALTAAGVAGAALAPETLTPALSAADVPALAKKIATLDVSDGWGPTFGLEVGDVFTIEGYFDYDVTTGFYSNNKLQQFKVTAVEDRPNGDVGMVTFETARG